MKYLITGTPRSRTAWLSALMMVCGSNCMHEPRIILGDDFVKKLNNFGFDGISDPSAPFWSKSDIGEFRGKKIVFVKREYDDAYDAIESWSGLKLKDRISMTDSYENFIKEFDPLVFKNKELDDYESISRLVLHVLGKKLDPIIFECFNLLSIEQHLEKAKLKHNAY